MQRRQFGEVSSARPRPRLPLTLARASTPHSRPTRATSRPTASGAQAISISTRRYSTFAIREKVKFTFGMQAYNVLNHPRFATP